MKNVTFQQALLLLACIAAPIVAYKFLASPEAAAASMVAGMVLNFLLGRGDPPPPPPPAGPGAKIIGFTGGAAAVLSLALLLPGCSEFTSRDARTVLDVAQVACIIAHAESDDATVVQICGIADVLIPDLERILSAQRQALAKAKKAGVCK